MKKFVSIFLAACAMSAMSVTAFARQADAVNVMSDESLKLSFGEETFEQLIQPGQSYTYPLYLEQEGGQAGPIDRRASGGPAAACRNQKRTFGPLVL